MLIGRPLSYWEGNFSGPDSETSGGGGVASMNQSSVLRDAKEKSTTCNVYIYIFLGHDLVAI